MAAIRPTAIPEPSQTMAGMFEAIVALKQAVEFLTGQRGNGIGRVPTYEELIVIGLIQRDQIPPI